jgi:hypothetical protein
MIVVVSRLCVPRGAAKWIDPARQRQAPRDANPLGVTITDVNH